MKTCRLFLLNIYIHLQELHQLKGIRCTSVTKTAEREKACRKPSCNKPQYAPLCALAWCCFIPVHLISQTEMQNQLLYSVVALHWSVAVATADFKHSICYFIILIKLALTLNMKSCYITGLFGFLTFYFNFLKDYGSPYHRNCKFN